MKATELSLKGAKIRFALACVFLFLVIIKGVWGIPFIWVKIVEDSKIYWIISTLFSFAFLIYTIFYGVIIYIVYKKTKAKNGVN